MEQWMTISDASRILNVTERTMHRYVSEGKHQSKRENGRRYVLLDVPDELPTDDSKLTVQMQGEIEYLRERLSEAQQTISDMQERSDTIVLQLTKQLENQTLMLEDTRKESERSLWRRVKMLFAPAQ